jgi:hypothetical protein
VAHDGVAVSGELQLEALERTAAGGMPWAWWLVVAGAVLVLATVGHGYTAYMTIARIDTNAKISTPTPIALFQDVATNGPRVGNTVDTASRSTYTRALEQFVLDGTGASLGLAIVVGGLFVRANEGRK